MTMIMTYEEQGDVILESQGSVVFVDSEASDATVLFETAVGPQAVLTSDDAKNGGVNSTRTRGKRSNEITNHFPISF
jgi:hypothetical protein